MKIKTIIALGMLNMIAATASAKKLNCDDDKLWAKMVTGKTVKECSDGAAIVEKNCNGNISFDSTMGQAMFASFQKDCVTKVMNAELDKRLIPLKKSNPAQFKEEMKQQKDFNKGSQSGCDSFNACSGTMYRVARQECLLSSVKWRTSQIEQINSKTLTLDPIKKDELVNEKVKAVTEIKEFSELLCKMPKEVFKDQKVPDNCVAAAISAFTKALSDDCGSDDDK